MIIQIYEDKETFRLNSINEKFDYSKDNDDDWLSEINKKEKDSISPTKIQSKRLLHGKYKKNN